MKYSSFFTLVMLLFFNSFAFSQKLLKAVVKFPEGLDTSLIKIRVDNGRGERKLHASFINNQLIVKDTFYSKFAYLTFNYPSKSSFYPYSNSFFIDDTLTTITFLPINTEANIDFTWECKVEKAIEYSKNKDIQELNSFIAQESNELKSFLLQYGNNIYDSDSLMKSLQVKSKKLSNKSLEFIKNKGNSYYLLWYFRRELINIHRPDTLLKIFEASFDNEYKFSYEGNIIKTILKSRIDELKNKPAPYFKSVDIKNNVVDLDSFKGKFILLNFWASWCIPCIKEMPKLRAFKKLYKDKLIIISISRDSDFKKFKGSINKNKMEWINIFNDQNIENAYGSKGIIPQVYLINTKGILIYNNEAENDFSLKKLSMILKEKCNL